MTSQDARIRFEWGPTGGEAVSAGGGLAVVVDVLSFTTCVCIAVDRGIEVHPHRWDDDSAVQYAARIGAVLAEHRGVPGGVSLSPSSIAAARGVDRLVLPSPNGATVALALAERGTTVVAGALRNRGAVARWLVEQLTARPDERVAVVAAGERWPDGSLRPAVEDLWGAGAVVAALVDLGMGDLSPEAGAAAAAFEGSPGLAADLFRCTSGAELVERGFDEDVRLAGELDVSSTVPVLHEGAFTAAAGRYLK